MARNEKRKIKKKVKIILGILCLAIIIFNINNLLKDEVHLDVINLNQHQYGLKYGCESVATIMALQYKTNKEFDVYKFGMSIPQDKTKIIADKKYNNIYTWGDPDVGFVGDITGKKIGSTIYPKPLVEYINSIGYRAKDISQKGIGEVIKELKRGNPVVAWVSIDMKTHDNWKCWKTLNGKNIKVTFFAHSITLTGVDDDNFYYNDSYDGQKDKIISKEQFEKVYDWRGQKALVIQ